MQPISLISLLATLVLLFGFQGEQIVRQPLIIALLAVPIVIQVYLNAGIAYAIGDVGKEAVLDAVPLAGTGRQVGDGYDETGCPETFPNSLACGDAGPDHKLVNGSLGLQLRGGLGPNGADWERDPSYARAG